MRLFLLLAVAALAAAPESKRKELQEIQQQIGETRKQIEEYRKLEQALSHDLKAVDTNRAKATRRIEDLQHGIRQARDRQASLKRKMSSLRAASGSWKEAVLAELDLYARRSASDDPSYGTPALWQEALHREAIRHRASTLARLQGLGQTTEQAEAEARRSAAELLGKSAKAREEAERKKREYDQKAAEVKDAKDKLAAAQDRATELEETAKALTRLIRELERERKTAPKTKQETEWTVAKRSLPWPVEGNVSQSFGREKDPELKTWVIRQGVRIASKTGAPVSPVARGKVIFAGPFRSYGRVVILEHAGAFYSIYGDLGTIATSKGAQVGPGDVIAQTGANRAGQGELYLEFRKGSEALDPLVWLKAK
jgi:murein hydrolase activator